MDLILNNMIVNCGETLYIGMKKMIPV